MFGKYMKTWTEGKNLV